MLLPAKAEKDVDNSHREDPLSLHNFDNPSMNLITSLLTGNNHLTRSCSIKIALGAKTKLGFINGKCIQPREKDPKFEQ